MYVGNGFDIHRHTDEKKLVLGGLTFNESGFEAHSDGDIIIHAISDALLGSLRKKDLGHYFPSDDSTPKNISSIIMLDKVLEVIDIKKVIINNIDITIISEVINISKISKQIIENLAKLINIEPEVINIKGKSFENIGFIGEGLASACIVTVSVSNA